MHLDDEQVQRVLHAELGSAESSVGEHVSTCAECRSRVAQAKGEEQWVFDRLQALDHAQPRVILERITAASHRRVPAWSRVAAGIAILLAAAGVAYAMPGSPLPRVLERLVERLRPASEAPPAPTPSQHPVLPQAGIAVTPGDRLTIVFAADQPDDVAVVALSDSGEVSIRASGGTTSFTSDISRITIDHSGPQATTHILIPRQAPWVEIRARGRRIFLKENSRVVSRLAQTGKDATVCRSPMVGPELSQNSRSPVPLGAGCCPNCKGGPMMSERSIKAAVVGLTLMLAGSCSDSSTGPTSSIPFDPNNFVSGVTNPLFPLTPGTINYYEGMSDGLVQTDSVETTSETKTILGVVTTVVHDRVYTEGELTEDTFDWYAQDADGNVWYLGEDTKELEGGRS